MNSLSILATLALIDVPLALDTIPEVSSLPAPADHDSGKTYLHNGRVMEEATDTVLKALHQGIAASQPIALAWSIVLQEARERTQLLQDSRDYRLSQRAYDSLGQSQLSDSESNESFPHKTRPISGRRTSFGSDSSQQATLLEYNIECVQRVEPQEDVVHLIAHSSLQGPGAFRGLADLASGFCASFATGCDDYTNTRLRYLMLQVAEASLNHVQYGEDIISTILALLTSPIENNKESRHKQREGPLDIGAYFLKSPALMEYIFNAASSRFPFESAPLLELCSALANAYVPDSTEPFVPSFLKELQTFTTIVSEPDTLYDLLEDDPYWIELHAPLEISATNFQSGRSQQLALTASASGSFQSSASNYSSLTLPEGTRGLTLTDSKPMVVKFNYKQSGFAYLGRTVQQAAVAYSNAESRGLETLLESVSRIIDLLNKLLQFAARAPGAGGHWNGQAILDSFSDDLDQNADIISVIFDIFESELYEQHAIAGGLMTDLLSQCVKFACVLLPIQPARVWPFLGRSSLLGLDDVESRLLGVIASQEMPMGRYPFLKESLHLFEALIDDVVTRSVSKHSVSTAVTRFKENPLPSGAAGVKDSTVTSIIYLCTKHMVDMFESIGRWKSASIEDKADVQQVLCRTMNKLLGYCFNADDSTKTTEKIVGPLAPAAEYLLEVFLSRSSNEMSLDPFIQNLSDSLQVPSSPIVQGLAISIISQTISTIQFMTTLIKVNAYIGRPACRLEEQLFALAEVLARNFAVHDILRYPIIELLHAMITGSSRNLEQPPSLLGFFRQQPARWFLDILATLGEPVHQPEYVVAVWKFLSAVVSQRQQWFAIYLLTGKSPRNSLNETANDFSNGTSQTRSLLDIALSKLCRIDTLDHTEAVSMLQFVSLAADFWLWVPKRLETNAALIKEFNKFITQLDNNSNSQAAANEGVLANKVQIAAYIANIFAVIVHRSNEKEDTSFAKLISPNLGYFVKEGVSETSYNTSLHQFLQKNFQTRYPGCKISNFKRTALREPSLGRNFFYDLDLAKKALAFDRAWARADARGFSNEVERANLNLSLVQAQIVSFSEKVFFSS